MTTPQKRNPSVAAGASQNAQAGGLSAAQGYITGHLYRAGEAIATARAELAAYALATDTPAFGVVDAADLLDAVAECLTPHSEFSYVKGGSGGGQ